MITPVALADPEEILRTVADRMAQQGLGVLPVVDRAQRVLTHRRHAPSGLPMSGPVAKFDRD